MRLTQVAIDTLQAYKDGYRTIVLKGTARSGKTVGIIQCLDFISNYSKRHRKLSIVSHSFPHLRDGAIYEYQKHQMRENITRRHNKGEHTFYVGNSLINYFSLDTDGSKAIGPGRDILFINEINRGIGFQDFNNLKTRTEEVVVADYNPSGQFFLQQEKILEDPRTCLIHSSWIHNSHNLSKAQIQDFIDAKKKSKTSDFWNYWWKVYGEGEDAVLMEERIMPIIKRCAKVPKDAVEIPSGLDFGWFPDPTTFIRLWVRKNGGLKDDLYIQQICYDTNLSISSSAPNSANLVQLLKARQVNPLHLIICESADPRSKNELRSTGFNIEAVNKTSVETSIRVFHDYNIFIVDGSEDAFREFDNYKYKRDRKGVILPIPADGQEDHTIDGIRYVLLSRNLRWQVK